jgi:hypothetical protein
METAARRRRVGVVGFGKLGEYLVAAVLARPETLELAFVWNRSAERIPAGLPVCRDLAACAAFAPDLIIEVAHPAITVEHGKRFLALADYMVGSPTVFADAAVEAGMRAAAARGPHGLYLPSGALWGAPDIQKMADRGSLVAATVTMRKHPSSFKVPFARACVGVGVGVYVCAPRPTPPPIDSSLAAGGRLGCAQRGRGAGRGDGAVRRAGARAVPAGAQQRQHHGLLRAGRAQSGL